MAESRWFGGVLVDVASVELNSLEFIVLFLLPHELARVARNVGCGVVHNDAGH